MKRKLSPRENEVYEMIVNGKTNREIWNELCISRKTLENHIGRIYDKKEVSNRIELVQQHYRKLKTGA